MATDFNRYDFIECWLPGQTQAFKTRSYKILEKDDLSLLKKPIANLTYFQGQRKVERKCLYDCVYKPDLNYNPKASRCDRTSETKAKETLHIEERRRLVPALTSSLYGKRSTDLEGNQWDFFKRKNTCKEFNRKNKVNMKPSEGLPVSTNSSFLN